MTGRKLKEISGMDFGQLHQTSDSVTIDKHVAHGSVRFFFNFYIFAIVINFENKKAWESNLGFLKSDGEVVTRPSITIPVIVQGETKYAFKAFIYMDHFCKILRIFSRSRSTIVLIQEC